MLTGIDINNVFSVAAPLCWHTSAALMQFMFIDPQALISLEKSTGTVLSYCLKEIGAWQ